MAWLRSFLLLFLLPLLLLSACSRVELAYERADWLGARWVANYLDLDREQRGWIRSEIGSYRDFHRRERLPEIEQFLTRMMDDLEAQNHERERIIFHLQAAESILEQTTRDLLPTVASVLSDLNQAQQKSLKERFERRRQEQFEERAERQEAADPDARRDRIRERGESWLGEIHDHQLDILVGCTDRLPDTWALQTAWEASRQSALLQRLSENQSSNDLQDFLEGWWLEYRYQPERLARARAHRREVTVDCLETFLPTLSTDQRAYLVGRLGDYREDVASLVRE